MTTTGTISEIKAHKFVEQAIRSYGKEVLEDRAIPLDMDGLKPSQRRILYSMYELGSKPSGNFMKCARVVGDCIGKFHPHGEASSYATLVNIIWDRYPLIEGHGNFGSVVGDPAAASRYTECRLTKLGLDTLTDLSVMPIQPNYSNETTEPLVLPSRVPLLLCNGSQGIAVGISCNIPPHNIAEIISATIKLVKKPETKTAKLLKYVLGPDYQGGGILTSSKKELLDLYKSGKGRLTFQCGYSIENAKDHKMLVIHSLVPYFNVQSFFDKCSKLKDDDAIEYANDETDHKHGVRLVVGFKNPQPINDIVLPMLSTTVFYDFYALEQEWMLEGVKEGGKKIFRHYNFAGLLLSFIRQRRHIEKLLLQAEEKKIEDDIELAEARLIATQKLDLVVKIIRSKKNTGREQIVERLEKEVGYTNRQADYVADLRLIQVANFSADEQQDNISKLKIRLKEIHADLKDLDGVLIRRLKEMRTKYRDERRMIVAEGKNGVQKLKMRTKQKWLMVASDSGYRSFEETPAKKGDWPKRKSAMPWDAFLTKGGETLTVVYGDGAAQETPIGYTKDGFLSTFGKKEEDYANSVVGIASEQCDSLVAISENAEVCAIENPQGKMAYQAGKFSTPVKVALGLNKDDKLLLLSKTGTAWWDYGKHVEVKRKNIKGKHIGSLRTLATAVVVKKGWNLYSESGAQLDPFKHSAGETFEMGKTKKVFAVCGGDNLAIDKDGIPGILSKQEVVVSLRSKNLLQVWPLE